MIAPHPHAATGPTAGTRRTAGEATIVPGASAGFAPESRHRTQERPDRIWTVLIAALGGEGGGVLSNWLVDAATEDGRHVQATSVPGVAQRTGATTYYLEIGPRASGNEDGNGRGTAGETVTDARGSGTSGAGTGPEGVLPHEGSVSDPETARPAMALLPTPGNLDLLVASELLEAGRAAQNGMITPARTTVIASTHRTFAIAEKGAMGDGRFEDERIQRAVRELSRRHVLADLGKVAERAGTVLSSVLLGAVAGSGTVPIPRERLRAAVERAGIAVEANLRGFDAGCRLFDDAPGGDEAGSGEERTPAVAPAAAAVSRAPTPIAARVEALPEAVREMARLGVERAIDYQDARYAALYLDRIERALAGIGATETGPADSRDAAPVNAILDVAREIARHLALWMCFEDIIRVADLKTRRARIERVRSEVRAQPGQPVIITEFLKPGVDEWCSLLPVRLARAILRAADRGGWRRRLNVGLHVRTSTASGFLLLWALARLRPLRRGTHRFVEEQAGIETWLAHVAEASATSPAFALEAARCANLVKGYGDTHERGTRNFERVMGHLADCARAPEPAARLRTLREAALADPEGSSLDAAIAALHADVTPAGSG